LREVTFRFRMMQPCLAGIKNVKAKEQTHPYVPGQPEAGLALGERGASEPHFIFNKDASGRALLMQENWTRLFVYACKGLGISLDNAHAVSMDPSVEGTIERYRRYYDHKKPSLYKIHEAFLVGSKPIFKAMVDDPATVPQLRRMLEIGGRYAGLTVFGWRLYGRFEVLDCG